MLEVTGGVVEGRLQLTWGYSENVHRRATMEQVANEFIEILQYLIRHFQKSDDVAFTPSDFQEFSWSQ